MTYSKSLQERFVSGRFTSLVLLGLSVAMWLVGLLFDCPVNDVCIYGLSIGNVMSRCITFACFAVSAFMWSSLYIFDRRIRWLFSLIFFLSSVSVFVHGSVAPSISLLFFLLVLYRLFSCTQGKDNRYALFSAFLIFSVATMLYPPFVMLLLPSIMYVSMLSLARIRELWAILLGLFTPYWFLFGIDYIFPDIVEVGKLTVAPLAYITSVTLQLPSIQNIVAAVAVLLVLIPFVLTFMNSPSPGKPLLRKRLRFFALFETYIVLLSMLYCKDSDTYYIWSLPTTGIMLAYIFSLNVTGFSKYYFVIINIIWLLMAPFSLWLRHL